MAVAIYSECGGLAYCNCHDEKGLLLPYNMCYSHVIFHKGQLHALQFEGSLVMEMGEENEYQNDGGNGFFNGRET